MSQPQIPVVSKHQHKSLLRYEVHVYTRHATLVYRSFSCSTWLLIDTGSTFNSIWNHQLLRSVRHFATMNSLSNGGILDYTQCGSLIFLLNLEVYYNPQFIADLLSIPAFTSKYCVTINIKVECAIVVHLGTNPNIKFTQCGNGLYYFDTANIGHATTPQDEITNDENSDKSKIHSRILLCLHGNIK